MSRMIRRLFCSGLCVLFLSGTAQASGFSIFEQGARGMGIAGAFAARAADLSAIFHNPAGLAQLYGTHVQFGTTLITMQSEFTRAGTYEQAKIEQQWFYPSTAYIASRFTDKITVGFGFYTQFGLGWKWKNADTWMGRYISKDINLQTFFFNPVVAYDLNDQVNVAFGVSYVMANADLSRAAHEFIPDVYIEGDGTGTGFNAGIQFKANEKVTFGASYRSEVKLDIDGTAKFTYAFPDPVLALKYPDSDASLQITTPAMVMCGMSIMPSDKISAELDINWTGWSSYDELVINFKDPALPSTRSEKLWNDVFNYRFGVEYYLSDTWTLRCGSYFDKSPVDDEHLEPLLPDADRNGINIGIGWTNGTFTVDAAYLHIFINSRATETSLVNFNGSYDTSSDLFGLSLGYKIN